MRKIVLISCVSMKLPYPARAEDLYVSPLFRLGLKYAHSLSPDEIFILSANHGLVDLDQVIEPYEETLNTKGVEANRDWAKRVLGQLRALADLDRDEFIFLAGERYRRNLVPHIQRCKIPMEGLTIGRQLQFLAGAVP